MSLGLGCIRKYGYGRGTSLPSPREHHEPQVQETRFVALGLIVLLSALWLRFLSAGAHHRYHHRVEVKRTDKDGPISQKNPADGPTVDVYYIYTERSWRRRSGYSATRIPLWGWPFYFSSTPPTSRQGQVHGVRETPGHDHLLHGWRVNMFSPLPQRHQDRERRARCLHLELLPLVLVRRLGPW